MDLPLHAALVEVVKYGVLAKPAIHRVNEEFAACRNKWLVLLAGVPRRERPQLNIFPFLTLLIFPQDPQQDCQVLFAIHQRLTMIRKRQGHHSAAPEPVLHTTECNSVL